MADSFGSLAELYEQQLAGAVHRLLDLCSSWCTHLPAVAKNWEVVGHGMNAAELRANHELRSWFVQVCRLASQHSSLLVRSQQRTQPVLLTVQDLNEEPRLGQFESGTFDAVLCANGWQYLTQPEALAAELSRVLVPSGIVVISFSSHCFEEKAIVAWLCRDMEQRADLVCKTLLANGFVTAEVHGLKATAVTGTIGSNSGGAASSNSMRSTTATQGDPCVVVLARTPQGPAAQTAGNVREWLQAPAIEAAATDVPLHGAPLTSNGMDTADLVLQWQAAYMVLAAQACDMGIPASAIPPLPHDGTAQQVQDAHEHLQNMLASFLSAGL